MGSLKKSRFTIAIPVGGKAEKLSALYHAVTKSLMLLYEKDWVSISNDLITQLDSGTINLLLEQGFLLKEEVDEIALFETWKQQYVHDFTTLRSKILVTRACNNRCHYCVVKAEAGEMSPETARLMDSFYFGIIKSRNPQRVKDEYSGGEPLLNQSVIRETATRRFFFCAGRGIEYGFTMVTNGTLLSPSVISDLKEVGLEGIRVSLAGPAAVHDKLRPSRETGRSYDRIMENLRVVSGLVPITVECQYDSGSSDYRRIPEMMDDFGRYGISVETIVFTPIFQRREESLFQSGTGDPAILLYLMREAMKRGYPQLEDAPSNACVADFRSRFVFDTDGSILPCPVLQSGEMVYGHVSKGIDFVGHSQILRRKFPDRCLNECELLPLCMGGCRLQALVKDGDFNGVDCRYDLLRLFVEEYIKMKTEAALAEERRPFSEKAA